MADEDEDFEFQLRQQQLHSETAGQQSEGEQGGATYTDPSDGTVYEWDAEKRAWFPKIDADFIAMYQASYGVPDPTTTALDDGVARKADDDDEGERKGEGTGNQGDGDNGSNDKGEAREGANGAPQESESSKRRKLEEGWFELEESKNTNVYVTGLPFDITDEEYTELMSKYGIIKEDNDGQLKLKLYRDENGDLKGDGRCCYLKRESVDLAIQLLNDSVYRGYRIYVELTSPASLQEIREDVREECEKFGPVRKIMVFDRHPDGIVSVAFKEFESADMCIKAMQGRYFASRRIQAHAWDGVTNYQVEETGEERARRQKQWETFLEEGSAAEDKESTNQTATT